MSVHRRIVFVVSKESGLERPIETIQALRARQEVENIEIHVLYVTKRIAPRFFSLHVSPQEVTSAKEAQATLTQICLCLGLDSRKNTTIVPGNVKAEALRFANAENYDQIVGDLTWERPVESQKITWSQFFNLEESGLEELTPENAQLSA